MDTQAVRLKVFISENIALILSACIILLLLGGYLIYTTHVEPGTEIEEFEESRWSSSAEVSHSATVQTGTSVFAAGDVLENRNSYFTQITPELDGTVSYTYQASAGGDVDVAAHQRIVLQSVGESDDVEFEYWSVEEELETNSTEGVSSGEIVEFPFSLNVSEQMELADEIEDEFGGTPGSVELLVVTDLSVSGVKNDRTVEEAYQYETVIADNGNTYQVENVGPFEESDEVVETREVERTHGPLRSAAGPAIAVLALLAVFGIGVSKHQRLLDVSEEERDWLAFKTTYNEHEEWVSTGTVSDNALPSARVTVDSLDGLVDTAIDSNRRVIYDAQRGLCLVIVNDTAYVYEPPVAPGPDPLAVGADTEDDEPSTPIEQDPGTNDDGKVAESDDDGKVAESDDEDGRTAEIVDDGGVAKTVDDEDGRTEGTAERR